MQPQLHSKHSWDEKLLGRLGKIVVGNQVELRRKIFYLFHGGSVGGHSSVHATRHKISGLLY